MPPGYVILQNSEVTAAMQRWAYALDNDSRTTYGNEFDRQFALQDGTQGLVTARVEHHSWTTDSTGNQVCGCRKGITLYHSPLRSPEYPSSPSPTSQEDGAVSILGYLSLGLVLFSTAFAVSSAIIGARARRHAT
jgi:hypothetical protein